MYSPLKIGLFDSGLGGLSLLPAIYDAYKAYGTQFFYFADKAYAPYGDRTQSEVQERAKNICHLLLDWGADLIVVPCNTATTQAITFLRQEFPAVPFVGVEPFVSAIHKITPRPTPFRPLLLLTPLAKRSERFKQLIMQHDPKQEIAVFAPPTLASFIEESLELRGSNDMRKILREVHFAKLPHLGSYTHAILGCTHYPLIAEDIAAVLQVECVYPVAPIIERIKTLLPPLKRQAEGGAKSSVLLATSTADKSYYHKMLLPLPATWPTQLALSFF